MLGTCAVSITYTLFYVLGTWSLSYGVSTLGFTQQQYLGMQMVSVFFFAGFIVVEMCIRDSGEAGGQPAPARRAHERPGRRNARKSRRSVAGVPRLRSNNPVSYTHLKKCLRLLASVREGKSICWAAYWRFASPWSRAFSLAASVGALTLIPPQRQLHCGIMIRTISKEL